MHYAAPVCSCAFSGKVCQLLLKMLKMLKIIIILRSSILVLPDDASFDAAGAVNVPYGRNDPDNNCNRYNAYNTANAAKRNSRTLFMYAVAPSSKLAACHPGWRIGRKTWLAGP